MKTKKGKIPTLLGIVLLLATVFAGVFFINYQQIFKIGATGETEPNDVRVSNINDSSVTISWTTDAQTVGFISWDKGVSTQDNSDYTHHITLNGLSPNTNYNFKINSNGKLFDNNGVPWQAITSSASQIGSGQNLISGSVLTATGQPVKNSLVYINVEGSLFSTLTSNSGNYVFQLPDVNPVSTLLEIFVQAGPLGTSSAQIYPQSAKPVPPMILGNTHDFRNLTPSDIGSVPGASLNLPNEINQESKFVIPEQGTPSSSASVTLETIDEGETVTSTKPEFLGEGPAGATLSIKIESESPISENVSVDSTGSWNWSPPEDLSPGVHKITITWKDISGITRVLTRNFVVQAGEAPAFEASGSAQISTLTPTPTSSPKSTSTSKATSTPAATSSPIPETGSLTPTFILSIMGVLVMVFSFLIWKNAQSI